MTFFPASSLPDDAGSFYDRQKKTVKNPVFSPIYDQTGKTFWKNLPFPLFPGFGQVDIMVKMHYNAHDISWLCYALF